MKDSHFENRLIMRVFTKASALSYMVHERSSSIKTTVATRETPIEPRHPRRLEKKTNIVRCLSKSEDSSPVCEDRF
ncbi:MAG: hypothetical protein JWN70_5248 [Planctomycetaceae bacterium]|nr:hypothetical protein [Planctomycetaceae bacterium]